MSKIIKKTGKIILEEITFDELCETTIRESGDSYVCTVPKKMNVSVGDTVLVFVSKKK